MARAYVALGDHAAAGHQTLILACRHCERRGRYQIAGLIERYGVEMGLPQLMTVLSADCPLQKSVGIYDRCGIHLPDGVGRPVSL
jgi:hypothetical protein